MTTDPTWVGYTTAEMASLFAVLGYWTGVIPAIATFLAVVWYLVQLWESPLGVCLRARFRRKI